MTAKSAIHRYLDPGETLAEVLFGLIMALTITVGGGILGIEGARYPKAGCGGRGVQHRLGGD